MREIDEVRITLLRAFRQHSTNHPNSGGFAMMHLWDNHLGIVKSINRILQDRLKLLSSIKLQAYGRGLLVRLRDMKLVSTRRTTVCLGMYRRYGRDVYTKLNIDWDYKALFTRARGDRALRRSRKALGIRKGGPLIWKRLVLRRRAIEEHYIHRNQLGVKLLDFGEP